MVRMTAELLLSAPSRLAPTHDRDRELYLRGRKLGPELENLAVLQDSFGAIDLSDNELARLERFPLMRRLRLLTACNNRVARLGAGMGRALPQLDSLVLTGNRLATLADCAGAAECRSLTVLSLLGNPVCGRPHYRLFFVNALPRLRLLDLTRVTHKERL